MSVNIGTEESPLLVFVAYDGGTVDAMVRATNEAAFIAAAKAEGLMYEVMESVIDPDTGETSQVGTGEWQWASGVNVSVIGPVMIVPGVYAEDGAEITMPIFDNRYHVNLRLIAPSIEQRDSAGDLKWHKWAAQWTLIGVDDAQNNSNERAKVLMEVALIDPETINTPSRVWL